MPAPNFTDLYTTDVLLKKDPTGETGKIVITSDTYAMILAQLRLIK